VANGNRDSLIRHMRVLAHLAFSQVYWLVRREAAG
jgi:hypothetical protein